MRKRKNPMASTSAVKVEPKKVKLGRAVSNAAKKTIAGTTTYNSMDTCKEVV